MPTGQEVANGTAVTGDEALETPFIAQNVPFIAGITTARITVDALVGTHYLSYVALLHQCLEGWQIGLPQVALGQLLDVKRMAVPFRSAMYGKVLGASQQLFVFVQASFAGHILSL